MSNKHKSIAGMEMDAILLLYQARGRKHKQQLVETYFFDMPESY